VFISDFNSTVLRVILEKVLAPITAIDDNVLRMMPSISNLRPLLAPTLAIAFVSSGCMSERAANAIGEQVWNQLATQWIAPPLQLAKTATEFQEEHHRWPTNYAEICSFDHSTPGSAFTNYDRIDFNQKPDGSLEVYMVAPTITNKLTLSARE